MAVFLGNKYEVHLEDDCIYAIEMRDKRKVLHIPKGSPYYEHFEAYLASPLDIDEIIVETSSDVITGDIDAVDCKIFIARLQSPSLPS